MRENHCCLRIDALESNVLRNAIPCMKRLTEIHLPTDGWSSHADRQRLLWALPRTVTVKWSKANELRSPKKDDTHRPNEEGNEESTLSTLSPSKSKPFKSSNQLLTSDRAEPHEMVGLSQLIVGWRRISDKKKKLLHGHLADLQDLGLQVIPRGKQSSGKHGVCADI